MTAERRRLRCEEPIEHGLERRYAPHGLDRGAHERGDRRLAAVVFQGGK